LQPDGVGPAGRERTLSPGFASRAARAAAVAALLLGGVARSAEPPPAAVLAVCPFLDADPNQVKIDLARPGSRPLPVLVHTGALQSFATAGAARELGLMPRRTKQTPYRRDTRLGQPLDIWVDTRTSDTGSARGGDYALVGAPFLSRFVVEIDFPGRRVRFFDPARYQVPDADPPAAVLPLRRHSLRPIVEIEVGGIRVPAVVESGAPGTLILPGGWAGEKGADIRIDLEATAHLQLPPGAGPMQAAVAARVALGPFTEQDVPILVAPQGVWNAGARSEALIGVDLLKRFVLRIDEPHGRLWLRDGRAAAGAPAAPAGPSGRPP
jgi:hypothetical protein